MPCVMDALGKPQGLEPGKLGTWERKGLFMCAEHLCGVTPFTDSLLNPHSS